MRIQVDRRIPATCHADGVTGQRALLARGLACDLGPDDDAADRSRAGGMQRHKTPQQLDTSLACLRRQRARRWCAHAHIDDTDLCTRLPQHQRVGIGAVVVGQQHDALAQPHAVQRGVIGQRAGQHHPRQVVVAKHHRPLMGAGGQHDLRSAHPPQTLAKSLAPGQGQVVGQRLADGQEVAVVVTEHHAPADDAHLGHRGQFLFGRAHPLQCRLPVDASLDAVGTATQMGTQLGQDHACAAAARCQRGGQAGHPTTGDQHIAVDVLVHITVLVFLQRRGTQATGLADEALVPHPGLGGPHECLVVEPGGEQRREPAVDAQQMLARAGPGVHAVGLQVLVQLDLGHLRVGDHPGAGLHLHQRRGLLDTAADDAARPVVLPGARQHGLAGGQHGRGQRVACKTLVAATVEAELHGARAIDPDAAGGQAGAGHATPPPVPAGASGFSPGL
jgi:hypothetical protein